jgi:hypothetical protein
MHHLIFFHLSWFWFWFCICCHGFIFISNTFVYFGFIMQGIQLTQPSGLTVCFLDSLAYLHASFDFFSSILVLVLHLLSWVYFYL